MTWLVEDVDRRLTWLVEEVEEVTWLDEEV